MLTVSDGVNPIMSN